MRATDIRPEHVTALLAAAKDSRHSARDYALVRLLVDVGMRPTEAASLTWGALVDAEGQLTGRCVWRAAKRGKIRDLELSSSTLEALEALRTKESEFGLKLHDPVFLTERNGRFADQSMRVLLKTLAAKAGLQASGYSIRHLVFDGVAQTVVQAGGSGADLLAFTGHRSLASVGHYLDKHSKVQDAIAKARADRCAAY